MIVAHKWSDTFSKQKASDVYLGKEPIIQMQFYVLFCQTDSSYFGMHWVHLVARKC